MTSKLGGLQIAPSPHMSNITHHRGASCRTRRYRYRSKYDHQLNNVVSKLDYQ